MIPEIARFRNADILQFLRPNIGDIHHEPHTRQTFAKKSKMGRREKCPPERGSLRRTGEVI